MAPPTRTPREKWIEEGLRALADRGPDAVRVEPIARALGVSKGGFYWHFDDRRALLDEMLDTWERVVVDEVIVAVEQAGGEPRARLERLFAVASAHPELLGIDLAVRDWARRDPDVAVRLRRADNRRMAFMRTLFGAFATDAADAEVRSTLAFALWIGNHFIAADHGELRRSEVLELALRRLLA